MYLGVVWLFLKTRRYGRLHGPTSSYCQGFGLWPRFFCFVFFFGKNRANYAILAHFRSFLVSSSNLDKL